MYPKCIKSAQLLGSYNSSIIVLITTEIVTKVSRTLNFIKHNLSKCLSQVKEPAYLMMVRSQVEYALDVWDSHCFEDITVWNQKKYNKEQPVGCWMIMEDLVQLLQCQINHDGQPFKLIARYLEYIHCTNVLSSVITYNPAILLTSYMINETVSPTALATSYHIHLPEHIKIDKSQNNKWLELATHTSYWSNRYWHF